MNIYDDDGVSQSLSRSHTRLQLRRLSPVSFEFHWVETGGSDGMPEATRLNIHLNERSFPSGVSSSARVSVEYYQEGRVRNAVQLPFAPELENIDSFHGSCWSVKTTEGLLVIKMPPVSRIEVRHGVNVSVRL